MAGLVASILGGVTHLGPATPGTTGQVYKLLDADATPPTTGWEDETGGGDHGDLGGLADDDHPQYAKKAGDTFSGHINGTTLTMGGVGLIDPLKVDGAIRSFGLLAGYTHYDRSGGTSTWFQSYVEDGVWRLFSAVGSQDVAWCNSDGEVTVLGDLIIGSLSVLDSINALVATCIALNDVKATIVYVDAAVAALVDSSPSTLDTLNELAAALGDDPNLSTTLTTLIGTKQAGDGDLTALAALTGTNTIYYRSAADTWTAVTIGGSLVFTGGTLAVADAGVTLAKMANLDAGQFVVRYAASTGVPQVGTFGSGLSLNTSTGELTASGGGGSSIAINTKSGNYIADATDVGKLIDCTAALTLSLTAAATLGAGWFCWVRNSISGRAIADAVVVDPDSTEQIDGLTTETLYHGEVRKIICTGTAFTTQMERGHELVITADGSYITPHGAMLIIDEWGGGGGGGGGTSGTSGTDRLSGTGGGGGAHLNFVLTPAVLTAGATVACTVAAATGNAAADAAGTQGGSTLFGTFGTTYGGGGGRATSSARTGGAGGGTGSAGGNGNFGGDPATVGIPNGGTSITNAPGGFADHGGAGGGSNSADTNRPGGQSKYGGGGGGSGAGWNVAEGGNFASSAGGSTGGAMSTAGGGGGAAAGGAGTAGNGLSGGHGGGGGTSSDAGTGGAGGAGGTAGGGGGGGGIGATGGVGGVGGRGEIRVRALPVG